MALQRVNGFSPDTLLDRSQPKRGHIFRSLVQPAKGRVRIDEVSFQGGIREGIMDARRTVLGKMLEAFLMDYRLADKVVVEQYSDPRTDTTTFIGQVYILTEDDLVQLEEKILASIQGDAELIRARLTNRL